MIETDSSTCDCVDMQMDHARLSGKIKRTNKLIVVTECPSKDDFLLSEFHSGREGKYLIKLLKESGFDLKDVGFTTVVKCDIDKSHWKKKLYLDQAVVELKKDISKANCPILCLGQLPTNLVLERKKSESIADIVKGSWPFVNHNGREVWVWYAPNFMLSRGKFFEQDTIIKLSKLRCRCG